MAGKFAPGDIVIGRPPDGPYVGVRLTVVREMGSIDGVRGWYEVKAPDGDILLTPEGWIEKAD